MFFVALGLVVIILINSSIARNEPLKEQLCHRGMSGDGC
jgi:hypothetical protein